MIASHRWSRAIRFAETDSHGQAYFATYIRLMEETEYSFLRSRQLSVVLTDDRGIMGFPRLSAELEVANPLAFQDQVTVHLELGEIDGKQIRYDFELENGENDHVARGQFRVACCRFPPNSDPFAILTPDFVIDRLSTTPTSNQE